MNTPITVTDSAIKVMVERGGAWYAYRARHPNGETRYMKCGKGCAYARPPESIKGHYHLVGKVDIKLKTVEPI